MNIQDKAWEGLVSLCVITLGLIGTIALMSMLTYAGDSYIDYQFSQGVMGSVNE